MDSVSRISAEQGGTVDNSRSLLDFVIPNDGSVVDLSKSYFSLKFKNTSSHADANVTDAIFNNTLNLDDRNGVTTHYTEPVGLIKHANMSNANFGSIENLRDVNALKLNKKVYFTDEEQQIQSQLNNVIGVKANKSWGYISPMIQASNNDMTGNLAGVASRNIDAELRVPLKDVFNFCRNSTYSLSDGGDTNVHLELDYSRLSMQNAFKAEDFTAAANRSGFGQVNNLGADGNTLTLTKVYNQNYREEIPYYIGMPIVTTSGNIGAAPHGGVIRKITNITYDEPSGTVSLVLNSNIGGTTTNLVIGPLQPTTQSFEAFSPQLVLYKRGDNPEIQRPYSYTTFTSERDNLGGLATARRQYEVEPECVNLLVAAKNAQSSLYADQNLKTYRISVDNEDITNRDVFKLSPLNTDRVNRYGLNSGEELKQFRQSKLLRLGNDTDQRYRREEDGDLFFIMETLPVTDRMKLVEIQLEANAGTINEIQIFKELIRSY